MARTLYGANGYVWYLLGNQIYPYFKGYNLPLLRYLREFIAFFPVERQRLLQEQLQELQKEPINSIESLNQIEEDGRLTLSNLLLDEIRSFFTGKLSESRLRFLYAQGFYNEDLYQFILTQAEKEIRKATEWKQIAEDIRKLPEPVQDPEELQEYLSLYPSYFRSKLYEFFYGSPELTTEIAETASSSRKVTRNELLARYLEQEAALYTEVRDKHRKNALLNSAEIVRKFPKVVTDAKQLLGISGIGEGTLRRVREFLATDPPMEVEEELTEMDYINFFTQFRGIGDSKARILYENGYRTKEDLDNDRLGLLSRDTRITREYELEIRERIPREVITRVNQEVFIPHLEGIEYVIGGSYRRLKASSGDIDLLIRQTSSNITLEVVYQRLKPYILERLTFGKVSQQVIIKFPTIDNIAHRMDIRLFTPDYWAFQLMRLTGSQKFNTLMSGRARRLGYTLTENSLQNLSNRQIFIRANSEEEIFEALGVRYYAPEERGELTELELL